MEKQGAGGGSNPNPSAAKSQSRDRDTPTRSTPHSRKPEMKGVPNTANSAPHYKRPAALKGNGKSAEPSSRGRPCKEHSFLTDVADVRKMEQGLLQLLDDFHSGKLQAFGNDCSFEKMDQVREQQEKLAKLHFEIDSQQELHGIESADARSMANENVGKLIYKLQDLCVSIQNLQKSDSPPSAQ